jgi:hypothetical protein
LFQHIARAFVHTHVHTQTYVESSAFHTSILIALRASNRSCDALNTLCRVCADAASCIPTHRSPYAGDPIHSSASIGADQVRLARSLKRKAFETQDTTPALVVQSTLWFRVLEWSSSASTIWCAWGVVWCVSDGLSCQLCERSFVECARCAGVGCNGESASRSHGCRNDGLQTRVDQVERAAELKLKHSDPKRARVILYSVLIELLLKNERLFNPLTRIVEEVASILFPLHLCIYGVLVCASLLVHEKCGFGCKRPIHQTDEFHTFVDPGAAHYDNMYIITTLYTVYRIWSDRVLRYLCWIERSHISGCSDVFQHVHM